MRRILSRIGILLCILGTAATTILVLYGVFHETERTRVETEWTEKKASRISSDVLGSTERLSILPLVNWHSLPGFRGEMGVSYLIRTDHITILFDVGQNTEEENPSPLLYNMKRSGISLSDIDSIFLSHKHFDHVGGKKWERSGTFSLGNEQIGLNGKRIFVPGSITYPGAVPIRIEKPEVLYPGIASIGPISRRLFIGTIDEQALVVNVRGKGLVLISGCGHQTLRKILQRTGNTFSEKIYGIIGDLHYPVPTGRLEKFGINLQKVFASGEGPLKTLQWSDVANDVNILKKLNLSIVGIGGHDSSDETIRLFEDNFGASYRKVLVGKWIHVSPATRN
ncbi:MBL fold metallo-hydrolase [Leptospira gomenensis]|uniref:MBL fold metallo-hydrolase n=1 Tax=Leptospira gomenensis TaxID=2484974 RepID=A0A5F1YCG4_9LEPT|nr:MBL fold metallo-hydrolase [Leptospira gomenensis]TGK34641.1 MBL fold metallo-hydrolase [Leptospira gomenensis]TGK38552.1 MBL fold metallo-hydrolase [Leptospira gomenensis]TGK51062.1 MBL fold metallo-hydrolase [Leptospira gomenensis]TGK68297.1 MBL fold metallo-hydrolase [Leptospira gomenensis]